MQQARFNEPRYFIQNRCRAVRQLPVEAMKVLACSRNRLNPLAGFFLVCRVPWIPLVKLRRRAERKFLVLNFLVKVSFDFGIPPLRNACSSLKACESLICTYLHIVSTRVLLRSMRANPSTLLYNPFASSGMLIMLKTIAYGTERDGTEIRNIRWLEVWTGNRLVIDW